MKLFERKPKTKCSYESHKNAAGKMWHFLAHDDSIESFVVAAALVILLGTYVLYPAIGLALGTEFPIVAVVSGSMDHGRANLDEWWATNGQWYDDRRINRTQFQKFYLPNGFERGDVLLIRGSPGRDINVGDIVVYTSPANSQPIIHRVVERQAVSDTFTYRTKGDANRDSLYFEKSIAEDLIAGKAYLKIPKIGLVKVWLVDLISGNLKWK